MSVPARAAVIVNPISGTGGRPEIARRRAALAAARLAAHGLEPRVFVTERPGHARALARRELAEGASVVVAWGGDGTVNEVASALAFTTAALGVVPSGSGNGLARELGLPFDPAAALDLALDGGERRMDAGELEGELFFNVAGVGLDARVAEVFAAHGLVRRGFLRYVEIALKELFAFVPDDLTITADGVTTAARPLLVAVANARQYGNGAAIAPRARIDDGRLDVVVVAHRSPLATVRQAPKLFAGRVDDVPGVTSMTASRVTIAGPRPLLYHLDGEPRQGGQSLTATVHPGALRVRSDRKPL